MAKRYSTAVVLAVAFAGAVVIAGLAGTRAAPDRALLDPRRSTRLSGPHGASGLAEALALLGIPVERFEQPLFRLADTIPPASGVWLALLDPRLPLKAPELRALVQWIGAGGSVLTAGETGLEECFGLRVTELEFAEGGPRDRRLDTDVSDVRPATAVVRRRTERPVRLLLLDRRVECDAPAASDTSVALATQGGDTVAVRLGFAAGGAVVTLADGAYLTNEQLKETGAGLVVLPLLLDEAPRRVIVDEFHQGFGPHGSLFGAAWSWLRRSPLGWAMLQLTWAGLLALAAAAVRFGPALSPVTRARRSQLEHVDALAVGLERADGSEAAIGLMIDGLRRRLGRSGTATERPRPERLDAWLDSLTIATQSGTTKAAVARLKRTLTTPGDDQVLAAALAVEDLWEALQPGTTYRES